MTDATVSIDAQCPHCSQWVPRNFKAIRAHVAICPALARAAAQGDDVTVTDALKQESAADGLKPDCSHFTNGHCLTLACMAKDAGGRYERPYRFVGCDIYRTIAEVTDLRAQLAAVQREHAASAAQRDARVATLIAEVMHYTCGTPHPAQADADALRELLMDWKFAVDIQRQSGDAMIRNGVEQRMYDAAHGDAARPAGERS